jgi:hypothetical protein
MDEAADVVGQLLDRVEDGFAIVETGSGFDGPCPDAFGRRPYEYMLNKSGLDYRFSLD